MVKIQSHTKTIDPDILAMNRWLETSFTLESGKWMYFLSYGWNLSIIFGTSPFIYFTDIFQVIENLQDGHAEKPTLFNQQLCDIRLTRSMLCFILPFIFLLYVKELTSDGNL